MEWIQQILSSTANCLGKYCFKTRSANFENGFALKNFKITIVRTLFLLLFLAPRIFFSQEILTPTNEKTYTQYVDKVLKPILENDEKKFKNGILYDRVHPLAKLDVFNENDSINTSSYEHFMRAWNELQTASFNPTFLSYKSLKEISYSFERQNKIQVGIINTDFTRINPTALTANKASLEIVNHRIERISENKLQRLNKRRKIPIEPTYLKKHVLVISPLNSTTINTERKVSFEFGTLFLDNSSKKIKHLKATFENGKTHKIIANHRLINTFISQSFKKSGLKKVAFNVVFSDNTTLTTYASFFLKIEPKTHVKSSAVSKISLLKKITATKPFQGYDEPSNCGGTCYGKGEYKIFYANGNTSIQKPFIIVDGFDPNDVRKINTTKNSILKSMEYNYDDNLVTDLNNEGFDVIILNFPKYVIGSHIVRVYHPRWGIRTITVYDYRDGGADYIERNGKVLQALIDEIKTALIANGSSNKIKIAGPSMGALIVQYALSDMEQNNKNHHTDLFVSFDGPHKGANISIGLQKGLEYFNLELGLSALKTPSAKQMLINHYLSDSKGLAQGAPNYRDRFQNMMNTLGFPQQSRNVAVINGSVIGANTAQAGVNMVHGDLTAFVGFLRRNLWVDYTPSSGRKQVFRYLKKNWWGLHTQSDTRKYTTTSSNYGSLDNASGGILEIKGRIEEALGGSFPYYFHNGLTNIPAYSSYFNFWQRAGIWFVTSLVGVHAYVHLRGNFCFVPSKSALAFSGLNTKWDEQIGCRNLVNTNETPFDSYYAPNDNQEHAALHLEGVNWLLNEVKGIEQVPSVYSGCKSYSIAINGNDRLCNGQTATYDINNYNSTVNWSTSGNLQILTTTNRQITVKNTNPNASSSWIRAVLSNGRQVVSKTISAKPSISYRIENSRFPTISLYGIDKPINQQGIYKTKWIKTGGTGQIYNSNSFSTHATGYGSNWHVEGQVTVTNSCGTSTKRFYIRPSPNPCNEIRFEKFAKNQYRIIRPCDGNFLRYKDSEIKIQLLDLYGRKKNISTQNGVINLENTSPKGTIRLLRAKTQKKIKSKKIIMD